MPYYCLSLQTPFGPLTLFEEDKKIRALEWGYVQEQRPSSLLVKAKKQLMEWFNGQRKTFSLPLEPHGTDFQKRVWKELSIIPYGHVKSYQEIATAIKSAPRAVGNACAKNPLSIIIPCHRVVYQQGTKINQKTGKRDIHNTKAIGNYSGGNGKETKTQLLAFEGAIHHD